jgi:tRNA splicing endonuclease
MSSPMLAEYKSKKIFVSNKEQITNLLGSGFGKLEKNKLFLHPLEAAYLLELNLLVVKDKTKNKTSQKELTKNDILNLLEYNNGKQTYFLNPQEQFEIYKEIRSSGRVIRFNKFNPHIWFVYAPGVGREQERAQILLFLIDPKKVLNLEDLESSLALARQFRMDFVFGFIKNSKPNFIKLSKISFF